MWYWKDLLNRAGVDANSLKTWDGYTSAAKKLNSVLRPQGIEGVHLVGASHSPDIVLPLFMDAWRRYSQAKEWTSHKGHLLLSCF
jgi:ABC-type glycerol-3-phosphate transport system substrate-binding protein